MHPFSLNHSSFFLHPLVFSHLIMCFPSNFCSFILIDPYKSLLCYFSFTLGDCCRAIKKQLSSISLPTHHLPNRLTETTFCGPYSVSLISLPSQEHQITAVQTLSLNYLWLEDFQPLLISLYVIQNSWVLYTSPYLLKYKPCSLDINPLRWENLERVIIPTDTGVENTSHFHQTSVVY